MELTQVIVRELLEYNSETGSLFWKERDLKWFKTQETCNSWNARFARKEALTCTSQHGYKTGAIFGKHCKAHRIIHLWMTGEWPDQVDHINGDKGDNRWENLRNVDFKENGKNQKTPKNNTSGVLGVYCHKNYKVWRAMIKVLGKNISLGSFKTKEEAITARQEVNIKYGFHENHGR